MDRDRRYDRDRDRDRYGGGESYRPGRSPSRDTFRPRSPVRRPPPAADTYIPSSSARAARPRSRSPGYRRRSRSPPRGGFRGSEGTSWRDRPRSPPRRGFSPRADEYRRDDRGRASPRDTRFRSPARAYERERTPPPALKRSREVSPDGSRGYRSPPRAKRERLASPPRGRYEPAREPSPPPRRAYSPPREFDRERDRGSYRRRSRSPRRDERPDPYAVDNWRKRSPSPPRRGEFDSGLTSGRDSGHTSRRSSPPPVHPSRAALVPDERLSRPPPEAQSSPYRRRTPDRDEREYTRERDYPRERNGIAPPTGPAASYRNGDAQLPRAPPTGPASSRYPTGPAIPSGPSMSAHSRGPGGNPILSAPSRPRGGRGGYADYPPRRPSYPSAPGGRGGLGPGSGPPTGPRGPASSGGPFAPAPFRGSNNSTSTTYPRTQRFHPTGAPPRGPSIAEQHLADLAQPVPGGQKVAVMDPKHEAKARKLEEEAERLKEVIAEKERATRAKLREWDRVERESENAGYRAESAEQGLRALQGEGEGVGGLAF